MTNKEFLKWESEREELYRKELREEIDLINQDTSLIVTIVNTFKNTKTKRYTLKKFKGSVSEQNWVIEVLPSQRVRKKKCDFHNRYDGSCDYDEYFLYGGAVGSNDSWVSEPLHTEGYLTPLSLMEML